MIQSDELLFVVDEENNPLKPLPRDEVHKNGHWHRTSHVWVLNDKKQILCQKRSLLKDTSPGKWEPFFGGHLTPEMSYEKGAQLEVKEELGISIPEHELRYFTTYKRELGAEFQGVFLFRWNGEMEKLKFEHEEISEIASFGWEKILKVVEENDMNWSQMGYERAILDYIHEVW